MPQLTSGMSPAPKGEPEGDVTEVLKARGLSGLLCSIYKSAISIWKVQSADLCIFSEKRSRSFLLFQLFSCQEGE